MPSEEPDQATEKKRILMLSFRPPIPLTEGFKLRAYNTARIISSRYSVDLLTLDRTDNSISRSEMSELNQIFRQVRVFKNSPLFSKFKSLSALPFPSIPLQTRYYLNRKAGNWIEEHKEEYNAFYCLHLRTAPYLKSVSGTRIIDLIDATSVMYGGASTWATGFWKALYTIETRRLKKYERRIFRTFDKIFISSKFDRKSIKVENDLKAKCTVIPNGVRKALIEGKKEYLNPEEEKNWIFFLGKMDYAPNVDAVKYFAENQWPQIRKEVASEIKFVVAGTTPRPSVRRLETIPGVRVTGYLKNPYELMAKAKVVVVPLRYSAGIQNKILEAMALGKPVVTTPPGFRGIEATRGRDLVVTKRNNFVPQVIRLLEQPKKREEIGKSARKVVRERYNWDRVKEKLLGEIEHQLK